MPDSRGPSPSWRSRRSRRRSSSSAVIVASRDSCRSAARARARIVWASSGATSRSTCSSPREKDRSPGRRPTTSSASAPSSGKGRVCVSGVPDTASSRAVFADGGIRQHERLADRPQREHRVVADLPGHLAGRAERVGPAPEQQLVDHPTQHHLQRDGRSPPPATPTTASTPTAGTSPLTISSSDAAPTKTEMYVMTATAENHDPHHQAAHVDDVGQRHADVQRRPDHARARRPAERSPSALGGEDWRCRAPDPSRRPSTATSRPGPAAPAVRRSRSATTCAPPAPSPMTRPSTTAPTSGCCQTKRGHAEREQHDRTSRSRPGAAAVAPGTPPTASGAVSSPPP